MKKGFTLVELMIVVAIIAILAAIAIPNLMQSRAQANEANAIAACKAYFSSQILFQRAGFGANELSGNADAKNIVVQPQLSAMYAAPYIALYATNDGSGKPVGLINSGMAGAAISGNPDTIVKGAPDGKGGTIDIKLSGAVNPPAFSAYQGYAFLDDGTRGNTFAAWCSGFGFIATPTSWSTTGYNSFWVGQAGVVYARNLRATQETYADFNSTIGTGVVIEDDISKGTSSWQMTK